METLNQQLQEIFLWLIRSSFYGTVLLAIILLVRAVVKKQFRCRRVYWLWMLLLLRLVWPLNVQTTFSVFNLIPQGVGPDQYVSMQAAEELPVSIPLSGDILVSPSQISDAPVPAAPSDESTSNEAQTVPIRTRPLAIAEKPAPLDWRQVLCTIWLTGTAGLGAYVLISNFRLWRIVKRQRLVTRQDILDLLEDCKTQLQLQTVIGVVETESIKTPCLFGYLRPRLLLPAGTLEQLSAEQIRYVFLHELAHLKRHDILIGWLMAAVQVLHWFNPAIWYAMSKISADRELACDELALSTLKENEPQAYGSTILTFLERFARARRLPALAGIAENPSLARRRMIMISTFKNKKTSFVPVLAILALLAGTTFTSAMNAEQAYDESLPQIRTDRGKVIVTQSPSSENDYTLIVRFDDNDYGGAGWYDVKMEMAYVTSDTRQRFTVYVKAYIDGISELVFQADTAYWHHLEWAVPGKHGKQNLPTIINGIEWYPNWPDEHNKPDEPRGEQKSDTITALPFTIPFEQVNVQIEASSAERVSDMAMPRTTGMGIPEITDSAALQARIDAAEPGKTVTVPAGTYEQPIKISKSIRLLGSDPEITLFKVTANEPAIMIDTAGTGPVEISGLTIQWQLATSDKHEFPFAVAVKDTEAGIVNCIFRPLGNNERSPVAIRSMGFSEMKILDCDFTGFDYVVCYGEGTKGKMQDSFIRNCGHQGVILYKGAQATIEQNIITGSGYHAVRTTGGKLNMKNNLIINNKNRGVYLGNKSGSGIIENNLLIGNATGIDGMSACQFEVRNNVILKSTYAAIAARPYSKLLIQNNVLTDNPQGVIIYQEEGKSDPAKSQLSKNVFWANQTDIENIEGGSMVKQEPDFVEPGNGNYTLADPAFEGMGLKDPKIIFDLWQRYKNDR